ncbi:MAG: hypothetical protein M0036_06385 [Desulfobacteraceae bacterium]|nr:hypothetical protein [Desulfobacteraceae bacterium]
MEDSKKVTAASDESRMIDLTPAMEIPGHVSSKLKIIDLTEVLQSKPSTSRTETQRRAVSTPTAEPSASKMRLEGAALFDAIIATKPPKPEPAAAKPEEPVALKGRAIAEDWMATPVVELEVAPAEDRSQSKEVQTPIIEAPKPEAPAASDAVQDLEPAPAMPEPEATSIVPARAEDTLDLTEVVVPIDLIEEKKAPEETAKDEAPEIEVDVEGIQLKAAIEAVVEESQAADSAAIMDRAETIELDVAGEPVQQAEVIETPEVAEVIEITDGGQPVEAAAEHEVAPDLSAEEEEEVLELTEIVAAAELAQPQGPEADQTAEEEEEEIELIDIVSLPEPKAASAPAAIEALEEDDDDTIELTDIVDPAELAALQAVPVESVSEEDALQEAAQAQEVDDDTIELTDVVDASELISMQGSDEVEAPGASDEEIELKDIVDPAEVAAALKQSETETFEDEDEEVIELIDKVQKEEPAAAPPEELSPAEIASEEPVLDTLPTADEEIIELIDKVQGEALMVAPPEEEAPAEMASEEPAPDIAPTAEEEVIELVDKVQDETLTVAPPEEEAPVDMPSSEGPAPVITPSEQVIHLDDVLNQVRQNKDRLVENITQGVEEELKETMGQEGRAEEVAMGMDLEEAVEKVIRAKYGQTIEQLIATVVEKVVTREIESLKRNLLEDDE